MRQANTWLNYLRALSDPALDVAVYSLQWARDVRCIKQGAEHRRVGSLPNVHDEWLSAGYASRLQASPMRTASRISGAGAE